MKCWKMISEKINQLEEFLVVAKYKATIKKPAPGQDEISSKKSARGHKALTTIINFLPGGRKVAYS